MGGCSADAIEQDRIGEGGLLFYMLIDLLCGGRILHNLCRLSESDLASFYREKSINPDTISVGFQGLPRNPTVLVPLDL